MRRPYLILFGLWLGCCNCAAGEPEADRQIVALGELRQQVAAALRNEALAARQGENSEEVVALVEVWLALANDPRRDESLLIHKLGQRVRARLVSVKRKAARIERPAHQILPQRLAPGGAVPREGAPTEKREVDYGPELVQLIERVISPEVWDINGGPATIAYYAPGRALVVRAPGEVHPQVGQLVNDLRAAGGP